MGPVNVSLDADAMLADQREVLDYWTSLKRGRAIPRRADFRPGAIVRRLPTISLVEVSEDGYRYRLAGTGLREAFGIDLTGRGLDDMSTACDLPHWRTVCEDVVRAGAPASGFLPLQSGLRPPMVQAWLRLPLADETGAVTTILGYDRFLPLRRNLPRGTSSALPSWDDAIAALARTVFAERRATA